ncbi:MAG: phosphate ABC transporter substrate-binding protein [Planctomycetota bacterium]|nr:phosphate ABC transporter substrate-binding protein [Planctomycetota bacterium]
MKRTAISTLFVLALAAVSAHADVDPKLPQYRPGAGASGAIKSVGSDTMNNLMTFWGEQFEKLHPDARVEVEGKGSSTAPPALIEGSSTFGPMSRAMKSKEQDAFAAKFGYRCTELRTAIDMLAVYVHKDNPIAKTGLTLQQVDAMFSKTRKGGEANEIRTWGDVGLTGSWATRPVTLYGRNSASGTYGYFKDNALFKGDFKDTVKEQPGSAAVVTSVANDLGGIGYSGIGYLTADVVAVPLATRPGQFVAAEPANAYSGTYPLARFLYLAVNYKPGSQLEPLRAEFIKLVFSRQGQETVAKDGYFPVPGAIALTELRKVGLAPAAEKAR